MKPFHVEFHTDLVSAANVEGKLRSKIQRKTRHKQLTELHLLRVSRLPGVWVPQLPVVVTLTRVGTKLIDGHDNFRICWKPIVDLVAKFIGLDKKDNDPRVEWRYEQELTTRKELLAQGVPVGQVIVRIAIEPRVAISAPRSTEEQSLRHAIRLAVLELEQRHPIEAQIILLRALSATAQKESP